MENILKNNAIHFICRIFIYIFREIFELRPPTFSPTILYYHNTKYTFEQPRYIYYS